MTNSTYSKFIILFQCLCLSSLSKYCSVGDGEEDGAVAEVVIATVAAAKTAVMAAVTTTVAVDIAVTAMVEVDVAVTTTAAVDIAVTATVVAVIIGMTMVMTTTVEVEGLPVVIIMTSGEIQHMCTPCRIRTSEYQ